LFYSNDQIILQANAKTYMASMKRSGRLRGVVEFVASGSRMRIHIDSESAIITFLLAGV
jgi:staphylococcal nuclease domain-containing protein 1